MPNVTVQRTVAIAGITIVQSQARAADGVVGFETPPDDLIPAAKAGSLTTRSGDSAGVDTLASGHGITTATVVDVFWSGGVRYGCDTSVSGTAVTLSNGAGDVLPAQATAVALSPVREVALGFGGSAAKVILAGNTRRCHVHFQDDEDVSLLPLELAANEGYGWVSDSNVANPLAGDVVAKALVSNGDSANALKFGLGVIYDTGA